jgi:hypothetical protein
LDVQELMALVEAQLADGRNTTAAAVVHEAKLAKAEEVAEYWKSIAPVWGDRPTKGATTPTEDGSGRIVDAYEGEYANSIHVEESRGRVRVGSATKIAVFAEYGTAHMPEYACAQRTVEHFEGEANELLGTRNKQGGLRRPNPVGTVEA